MKCPTVVCPAEPELLRRLQGHSVVVCVPDLEAVNHAVAQANSAAVNLECVYVTSRLPLGLLSLTDRLKDIPFALWIPSMGLFRDVVQRLAILHQLNVRIFLPIDNPENITAIRILASLGIACTAVPGNGCVSWEAFSDLASYALLGLAMHAPVEPFEFLAREYHPSRKTEIRGVWFNDSAKFVHMDSQGRFAFTQEELNVGQYAGLTPEELNGIQETVAYRKRQEVWRQIFLEFGGCATCPGWRICLGTFSFSASTNPGCRKAFDEIMDIVEHHQAAAHNKNRTLWQA